MSGSHARRVQAPLEIHPLASLVPELSAADYSALEADIRKNGVKLPVLVYRGQLLDGRHRFRACQRLGIACPTVEWNGKDPWFELQSRNLLRRHLAKEQIYAIRKLASETFPELGTALLEARTEAARRKAQAKGKPRGVKALRCQPGRKSESADVIGKQIGVSGATVKRVDRLARLAPELLPRVAAGQLSVTKGLRLALVRRPHLARRPSNSGFDVHGLGRRLTQAIGEEWRLCPHEHRSRFLTILKHELHRLIYETTVIRGGGAGSDAGSPDAPIAASGR